MKNKISTLILTLVTILITFNLGASQTMNTTKQSNFEKENMFGTGVPNEMFAKYFTGNSYLNPLTKPVECSVFLANVTFAPGCANNWHTHHATKDGGQILICTAGEGWYQEEGKEAISFHEGSVIYIPAEVKHWHGAKADSWFSHIAMELHGENSKLEWFEEVSAADYNKLK